MNVPLLQVKELETHFLIANKHILKAVNNVSFSVNKGEIVGIVGESGSGKSVTARSIMGMIEPPGAIAGGQIILDGCDLLKKTEKKMRSIRGNEISIIFQNPGTSLNPLFKIETQMVDTILAHTGLSRSEARARAIECLKMVGISNYENTFSKYPCNFSDGYIQKIVIAMSLLLKPKLIIADEPTTNLGATVQQIIITSLKQIQKETGVSIIFITHDFGVIARISDRILVMYAGKIVESGGKHEILSNPRHPYTKALLTSVPSYAETKEIEAIPGFPPNMLELPQGCAFSPRCKRVVDICRAKVPHLKEYEGNRIYACFNPHQKE